MTGKPGALLTAVVIAVVVVGAGAATTHSVTVPLIWPLGATALCLFSGYRAVARRLVRQYERRRDAAADLPSKATPGDGNAG